MSDSQNFTAALGHLAAGRAIFPCRPDNKRPACMRGFHAATLDERQVRLWWRAGGTTWAGKNEDRAEFRNETLIAGSPCGAKWWGGYWVLDVDCHGEAQGPASLALLQEAFGELPPTWRASTWTGGLHLYWRHPGAPFAVPNRQSQLGLGTETWGEDGFPEVPFEINAGGRLVVPGIDVRGDGGYVICPGSVMLDGRRYAWLDGCSPDDLPLADAPDWLTNLVALRPEDERAPAPPAPLPAPPPRGGGERRAGNGPDFFREVNRAALAALGSWVPTLFPKATEYRNGATGERGYRVTSAALGRAYEEDLSLMPSGIRDYGPAPDEAGIGLTPIDCVLQWGSAGSPKAAALWLCRQVGADPAALGWQDRRSGNPSAVPSRPSGAPAPRGGADALRAFAAAMVGAGLRGAVLSAAVLAKNASEIDPPLPLEEAAALAAEAEGRTASAALCGCGDPPAPALGGRGSAPEQPGKEGKGEAPCLDEAPLPAARSMAQSPPAPSKPPSRPSIEVHPGELSSIADEAERCLIDGQVGIFQRGTLLVRIGRWAGICQWALRPVGTAVLIEVSQDWLVDAMTRFIEWRVWDSRAQDTVPKDAPAKVAKVLLARAGEWRFPYLTGFVDAPTLDRDGRLIYLRGYDAASGLYVLDPPDIGGPIDDTDRYGAERAVEILSEIVETFPFAQESDRSACLAAIMTALLRRSLPAAPICAISASTPGSGKSLLVDVIGVIAQGRKVTVANIGQDNEEFEKRLDSELLAGEQIVNWDNIDRAIKSDTLCSVTTQETKKVRILSKSVQVSTPTNIAWFMTGNNLTLVGDLVRRTLLLTLDPQCERPEQRVFERDAIAYALERRGEAIRAALTIARAYLLAGCPEVDCKPHGSFDTWEKLVRRPLIWAGCPDPLRGSEELREADQELVGIEELLAAWHAITRAPVTANELRELIDEQTDSFASGPRYAHPNLRTAAKAVMGDLHKWDARALGYRLRGARKRLFQGAGGAWYRIMSAGRGRGGALWRVECGPPWSEEPSAAP